jgi:hypothetical protein
MVNTALAIASLASTAVGVGVSIYGTQQQAKAQDDAARYNAQLAENEARNRENEAAESVRRARIQKQRQMAELRQRLTGQGTLNSSGTPLALLGESGRNMETSISDAWRASNMQAAAMRSQGKMGLWEASNYRTAANISSAATALRGAGSMASDAYRFKQEGALSLKKKPAAAASPSPY